MRDPLANRRLMHTLERPSQLFVRGQGSWLWDVEGRAYLDFSQGWAVNSLGHSPSVLVDALKHQAEYLIDPGPAFYNRCVLDLAARLCQATGSQQVHFLNSGAEANQAAIRLARKWGRLHRGGAWRIVTARRSDHEHLPTAFDAQVPPSPPMPVATGMDSVPYNDLEALRAAIGPETVAVMLEPVQGDAGVIPATLEYLQGAARACRERGVLFILDEMQTGIGRCGALLAEDLYGVRADILSLGKGLGGGVPLAALLARGNACCLEPGEQGGAHHGGNALMSAAGLAVLDTVLEPGFLDHVREVSEHLREGLARIARREGHGPLRGHGLLLGLPLIRLSAAAVVRTALEEGLLIDAPQAGCLRFTPALTISHGNIDEMLKRLARAFARCRRLAAEED
ncbi:aminotransferase class III-fold pyridoxal phosphate-dependent enzyme [Pseudomonas sp. RIT-PI-AD]|uniref:aminotransferase class III-fold pyridoxal phosphate-dependent enzyme n=1 Tax=Pseudomonas sp. RIT-PI-AD TaxID=3035294 RepID=UPI0021D7F690|nr:aminotransferase class III-fold pyridoxal phosphate-dependent enzyme [Pseudomonas sp. RIT-PI-AD]